MSDAYKNFVAVVELLEEYNVRVTEVGHQHDYSTGSGLADFKLTISVPVFEPSELREASESPESSVE